MSDWIINLRIVNPNNRKHRIANPMQHRKILSSLDRKIALNRKINAELEQMAKELYDYWFVQFDFPNAEGKPYKSSHGKMVYNDQLKRKIPEGWSNARLIDIANITMGQSPEGSTYNGNGDGVLFYQGSTDFGERFPQVRQYTTSPTRFAKKGDILMSVRAPVGATNIANNDCCIGRGLCAMNSKIGSITHLYYIIKTFEQRFNHANASGTTFGSITKEELHQLPVIKPEQSIINQFESICQPIFDKQMTIGEENNRLVSLRDQLLPLLMNGQVKIK
ncbi:MAG: restriction endonuclease subunit S [Bacteroidales bacterium]|nr:restriction endonuclease subunit S [Bacteroidales bacterium]